MSTNSSEFDFRRGEIWETTRDFYKAWGFELNHPSNITECEFLRHPLKRNNWKPKQIKTNHESYPSHFNEETSYTNQSVNPRIFGIWEFFSFLSMLDTIYIAISHWDYKTYGICKLCRINGAGRDLGSVGDSFQNDVVGQDTHLAHFFLFLS